MNKTQKLTNKMTGAELREERTKRKLTLEELGRLSDIHFQNLSRWERAPEKEITGVHSAWLRLVLKVYDETH